MEKILVINPGSTSTKIALYFDDKEQWSEQIQHSSEDLLKIDLDSQISVRKPAILNLLESKNVSIDEITVAMGRGGKIPNLTSGAYNADENLSRGIRKATYHASNLGGLLAQSLLEGSGKPSFIYDAVSSDELVDVARVTGLAEVKRESFCHVLNMKAMARRYAKNHNKRYEDMNFVIAHLGGGVSVSAHQKGRIIDIISDDEGPMSPERAGSIPSHHVVDMCYSGQYTLKEMKCKTHGQGGLIALTGTSDCQEIERRITAGDTQAQAAYEAFGYQIAKGIGQLAPTLSGEVDAVILTGGIAHSEMLTDYIKKRVEFIAPVAIMPGEKEMEALALGALRLMRGEEEAKDYPA